VSAHTTCSYELQILEEDDGRLAVVAGPAKQLVIVNHDIWILPWGIFFFGKSGVNWPQRTWAEIITIIFVFWYIFFKTAQKVAFCFSVFHKTLLKAPAFMLALMYASIFKIPVTRGSAELSVHLH
jgi:hypothetical protein